MSNERNTTPNDENDVTSGVDTELDALLPVPEESNHGEHVPDQTDGPIDELLPLPSDADTGPDDASTREELEVDTTADDVDDIIPLEDDSNKNDPTASQEDQFTIAAPVNRGHTPPTEADTLRNSHDGSSVSSTPSSNDTGNAVPDTCLMCGERIGNSRFCPSCGTEQIPASKLVAGVAPLFMWSRTLSIRITLSLGVVLILFALLADSGTSALIISASIVPLVLLIRLCEGFGSQNKNTWVQASMMILIGIAVGLPIAWLATRIVVRSWFEGGVINFGATNFGGVAVDTMGIAPILVWLTNGILLPLVVILVVGTAPGGLRMALTMPALEQTGMILSAAVAAGAMIGSAAVFYWPLFDEIAPIMSTSEWTLTILGVAIIRPLVWVSSAAMLGAVVWRYFQTASLPSIAAPASIAIGLPFGYSLVSLATGPTGLWTSIVAGIAFATVAIYFLLRFQQAAIQNDDQYT